MYHNVGAVHKRSDCYCCSVAWVIWTVEPIWCIKHHKYCPGPFPKEETDDDGAQGRALSWYYRVRERRKKKRVVQWASTFVVVNQKNHFLFFFCSLPAKGSVHKRCCLRICSFYPISWCLFRKLFCTMRNSICCRQPNNIFFLMPVKGSYINDVVSEMAIYIPHHPFVAFLVFEVCV